MLVDVFNSLRILKFHFLVIWRPTVGFKRLVLEILLPFLLNETVTVFSFIMHFLCSCSPVYIVMMSYHKMKA